MANGFTSVREIASDANMRIEYQTDLFPVAAFEITCTETELFYGCVWVWRRRYDEADACKIFKQFHNAHHEILNWPKTITRL